VVRGRYYENEDLGDVDSEDGTQSQSDWDHDDSEAEVYSVHDSQSADSGAEAEAGVVVRRVAEPKETETGSTEPIALEAQGEENSSEDERMIEVEVQRLRMQRRAERRARKAAL
jgi:hypothetical protein